LALAAAVCGLVKDAVPDAAWVAALKLDDLKLPDPGFAAVPEFFAGPAATALLLLFELLLVHLTTPGLRCTTVVVAAAPAAAVALVVDEWFAAVVDFAAGRELAAALVPAAGFAEAFLLRCCFCRCIAGIDAFLGSAKRYSIIHRYCTCWQGEWQSKHRRGNQVSICCCTVATCNPRLVHVAHAVELRDQKLCEVGCCHRGAGQEGAGRANKPLVATPGRKIRLGMIKST
jgi:hypothetical protein